MSKNQITKDELKVRMLKLKEKLYNDQLSIDTKEIINKYLNEVINIIDEYRY
jgi:hypothetical protein